MIIGFIGNDGSGKSTLAKDLAQKLFSEKKKVKFINEFDYFLLSFAKKIGKISTKKVQRDLGDSTKVTAIKKILPYIVYIDLFLQYVFLRTFFSWNNIIIRDRYAYDFLMTWRELGVSNKLIDFLYNNFPKPDILFYIHTIPEIARNRRRIQNGEEKSMEFYNKKTELYNQFVHTHASNIIKVENSNEKANANMTIEKYVFLKEGFSRIRTMAISGLDGAGKSTTVSLLDQLLTQLNVRHYTIHFYYKYIVTKFFGIGESKDKSKEAQYKRSLETEKTHKLKGKSKLWVWFVLTDAYLQYIGARIFHPKSIVIFDRFFHDFLVSFSFLNAPHNKQFLLKLFPVPDRYFLQIADCKILHQRKPEHTLEFFKECHKKYLSIAKSNNLIILDSSNKDEKEILRTLLSKI